MVPGMLTVRHLLFNFGKDLFHALIHHPNGLLVVTVTWISGVAVAMPERFYRIAAVRYFINLTQTGGNRQRQKTASQSFSHVNDIRFNYGPIGS